MNEPLDPARWARVEAVFDEVVALPAEERGAHLAEACAGETWLRREVESLLAFSRTEQGDRLGAIVVDAAAHVDALGAGPIGSMLGPYRLESELGRGGMGVVYLGVREGDDFDQRVAIKLLPGALFSEEMTWRFRNERRILASLEHPGVARFLDGGTTPEGVPFVVMEYVDGEPVDAYCAGRALDLDARLELFARICEAVRYAHAQLVVHRDIKPANILIDGTGAPKLLDFGIAKLAEPGEDDLTRTATRIMTPHFASPEQIAGETVTTTTDVYALGALLYLLLTGQKAHEGVTSRSELARRVAQTDPDPPSVVSGDRRLAGDLDTIVLKAMRRDPSERYESVDRFLQDVNAHRSSLPIAARPPTWRYRAEKFVRRNRAAVVAGLVATMGIVGGSIATTVGTVRAREAEAAAQEEARVAAQVTEFLVELFAEPDPDNALGEEMTARELLEAGVDRIDEELAGQPLLQARLKRTMGRSYSGLGDYEAAESLYVSALEVADPSEVELRAGLLVALGSNRRQGGRLDEALEALEAVADLVEPLVDTTDAETMAATQELSDALIASLSETGVVLGTAGDYDDAVAVLQDAFRLRERLSGPDSEETAGTATTLAYGYSISGSPELAVPYYLRAARIYEETQDERHPLRLLALDGLASNYARRGVFDSASTIFEQILPLQATVWGPEHPRTAQTLHNLGALHSDMGNDAQAEQYARRALDIEVARAGPDNISITSTLNNLAILRTRAGDLEEAEQLFMRATDIRRRVTGADNPRFASTLLGVANTRRQMGNWTGSAEAYAEALDVLRPLGQIPPPALRDYAQVLRELGREADAIEIERELEALTASPPGG